MPARNPITLVLLLRDEEDAKGLVTLLDQLQIADSGATFQAKPWPGLDYFSDTSHEPNAENEMPDNREEIYVVEHSDQLPDVIINNPARFFVAVPDSEAAAKYAGIANVTTLPQKGSVSFATALIKAYRGVIDPLYAQNAFTRPAEMASDFPAWSTPQSPPPDPWSTLQPPPPDRWSTLQPPPPDPWSTPQPPPPDPLVVAEQVDQLLPDDLSAHGIKSHLDQTVVGQDQAKIFLSVLLSLHLRWAKRTARETESIFNPSLLPPNAILLGPTGVGKTHSIRTAAEYLKLPFVIVDSTSLIPSGAREGKHIDEILDDLLERGNEIAQANDISQGGATLAARGVVFLDEFDKIQSPKEESTEQYHQWYKFVQRALLKLLEGDPQRATSFDPSGVLYIASGAFANIDALEIRAKRSQQLTRYLSNPDEPISADIVNYGFIPEIVARLPILVTFDALEVDDLVAILKNTAIDPAQVYVNHFSDMGKTLAMTDDARALIAESALRLGMGARGLQQVLFPMLARLTYEVEESSDNYFEVDRKAVSSLLNGTR